MLPLAGCITVYQPLSGLHRPAIVNVQAANFEHVRVRLSCVPGDLLSRSETSGLCEKISTLFENQGAQVYTVDDFSEEDALDEPAEDAPPPVDLSLEIRSFGEKERLKPKSVSLFYGSVGLLPLVKETTFRQEVVVRDSTGFLLATDTFEGRLITRMGPITFFGNKVLDKLARTDEEQIFGYIAYRELSADLYQQLSQLMFNAKMQWQVLQEASPLVELR